MLSRYRRGYGGLVVGCRRNYGPTIRIQKLAEAKGYAQVLWLFGENHEVMVMGLCNDDVML